MESPICFRILINHNFGDFEIKISKCNRTLEQPGIFSERLKLVTHRSKIYFFKSLIHLSLPGFRYNTNYLNRVSYINHLRHKLLQTHLFYLLMVQLTFLEYKNII